MSQSAPSDPLKVEGREVAAFEPSGAAVEELLSQRLRGLLEISNLVGSVMELNDILARIVQITADILQTPLCSIYLFDAEGRNLVLRASVGRDPAQVGRYRLARGQGLIGVSAEEGRMVCVADARTDPRHEPFPHVSGESRYRAFISLPLRIQEEVVGVMVARRCDVHEFSEEAQTLFETVCKQVAIVIEKSKMYFEKMEAERLAAISISLSEVAHYIKNLLQSAKGGAYFVDMGLKRGEIEKARQGWGVLQRTNAKIASLVENMLNYSREMPLRLEQHNINSVVFEVLHQIDDSAVERGVALVPETGRDLPPVPLDVDRIHDALLNLVGNAIDAIPSSRDDGLVIVRTRPSADGHYAELEVEDNGAGIPLEARDRVFNLFFSTKGRKGTGIGLAVTRKIVELHGGQISFDTGEGRGTTFRVRLPLEPPDEGNGLPRTSA